MLRLNCLLVLFFISLFVCSMKTDPKVKVIFFGDSITEQGLAPNGFISLSKEILSKKGLQSKYDLVGAGVSGNKIYDLYLRLENDVISKKPDVVIICIGVNDIWHKSSFGTGTDADKFEKFYTAIINKLQLNQVRVIIATPAVIGEKKDFSNQQDGDLNFYSQIIKHIAEEYHCGLLDLRKIFHEYEQQHNLENRESGILTVDRVHLNNRGNELVAENMVKILLNDETK